MGGWSGFGSFLHFSVSGGAAGELGLLCNEVCFCAGRPNRIRFVPAFSGCGAVWFVNRVSIGRRYGGACTAGFGCGVASEFLIASGRTIPTEEIGGVAGNVFWFQSVTGEKNSRILL